jgi:hypothetical protein
MILGIRQHPKIIRLINSWDLLMDNTALVKQAIREVISYLEWHWKHGDRQVRKMVWNIVRMVRGPRRKNPFEASPAWGRSLQATLQRPLAELAMAKIDDSRKPTLEAFQKLIAQGDIQTWKVDADCGAFPLWQTLVSLELCWPIRDQSALKLCWQKPTGSPEEIGFQAYESCNRFLLHVAAEELRGLDRINRTHGYFQRDRFQNLIERLFLEIKRMIVIEENASETASETVPLSKKPRNDPRVEDKEKVQKFMRSIWQKAQEISQSQMVDKVINAEDTLELHGSYKRETIEKWANKVDPLPIEERIRRPKTKNIKKSQSK